MNRYIESKTRTNKLYCSDCKTPIKKGENVIFKVNDNGKMEDVYCPECKKSYKGYALDDMEHPFSDMKY